MKRLLLDCFMIRRDLKTAGINLPPKMDLVVFIKPYALEYFLYAYIRDHNLWSSKSLHSPGLMKMKGLLAAMKGWIQLCYFF